MSDAVIVDFARSHFDGASRSVDRLHGGAAEAVDGHASHGLRQLGQQHYEPGEVQPLLAFREGTAQQ